MRIAVIGGGAMGSLYAAAFHRAGNEVMVVDVNRELVDEINENGLTLIHHDGAEANYRIRATAQPTMAEAVDLMLIQVKGFQTEDAAEFSASMIGANTHVLTLQNGMGNGEVLATTYPGARILEGISVHSATVTGLGRVAHTGVGPTHIGPFEGRASIDDAERAAAALEGSGFDVHVTADIKTQIWRKLILNCAILPVSALTRLDTPGMDRCEIVLELIDNVITEAVEIARADGVDVDREAEIARCRRVLHAQASGKMSMLQDVEAGRRTEIETINGAVVRIARDLGVRADLNGVLYALAKGYESSLADSP